MFIEVEDIFFTIVYTMIYTIWPIEGLVILTLCVKYHLEESKEKK